jgi:fatty-acid desaturase
MILAFAGAVASQGSIIWWSRLHRLHHRKSDTEDEEYSKSDDILIYEGYIYDMTDFMDKHPDGKSYIKNSC